MTPEEREREHTRLCGVLFRLDEEIEERRKQRKKVETQITELWSTKWRDDDSPKGEFKTASSPCLERMGML